MAQNEIIVRLSFFRLLRNVVVGVVPLMLLVNWAFDGDPLDFSLHPTVTAAAVSVGLIAFASWHVRYRVSEAGLSGYTKLFQNCFLPWRDIRRARVIRPFGFRYIEVMSSPGLTILIPSYVSDRKEFFGAILRYAPESNPVTEAARELLSGPRTLKRE